MKKIWENAKEKMKKMKRQKGVSMVSLVITIIVIIILTAVVFVASLGTIGEADYSNYVSNVSDVSAAFHEASTAVNGEKVAESKQKNEKQVYNYVAKDGKGEGDFLVPSLVPPYTIIKDAGQIGIELPVMTVESGTGKRIPIKYATTKGGQIFTWPPYDYENEYHITSKDVVEHKMQTEITVGDETFTIVIDSGDGSLLDKPIEDYEIPDEPIIPEEPDEPDIHTHVFTSKTTTAEYFCSAATCTEGEKYYYKCISCEAKGTATYEYGNALGHEYTSQITTSSYLASAATCTEAAKYYYACVRCSTKGTETYTYGEEAGHSFGTFKIKDEATCTQTGLKERKCSKCSETETETIPKDLSNHVGNTREETVDAKCTTVGSKKIYCTSCNGLKSEETIVALGHDFTSKVQTTTYLKSAATCTEAAVYYYKCSRCEEKGTTTYTHGEEKGHSFGEYTETKPATCLENGTETRTCSACSKKETKTITALGHDWDAETPPRKCNRCGLEELLTAQAIYTGDDKTLTFIKEFNIYNEGDTFNGKTVTNAYTGIEEANYTRGWDTISGDAVRVVFRDEIKPLTTKEWFSGFSNCESMDVEKLNTEKVTNMLGMFWNCSSLQTIDVSKFNTSNVNNMESMFSGCFSIETLNLSGFNTQKIENMNSMFNDCRMLSEVTLGSGFEFKGTAGYLPVPDRRYITGADGKWYNKDTKIGYVAEEIPNNTEATYVSKLTIYTITYDLDGGSEVTSNPTSYTSYTSTFTLNNPTKKGYTFVGWTGSNGTSAETSVTIALGSTGNRNYTAKWNANTYTFKYNANGGTGTMADTVVTYGVSTATRTNTFTKTGYTFDGWHLYKESADKWLYKLSSGSFNWYAKGSEPDGAILQTYTNGFSSGTLSSINNDVFILYAQWKANTYTFKYDANGGTGTMADTVVTYGVSTATRANTFTKTGYTFDGWHVYKGSADKWLYKLSSGSFDWYAKGSEPDGAILQTYTNGFSSGTLSSINNDVFTLYAQWKANTYTFKYDANGGTGTMADTVTTYGITTATRTNTFTRTGYSFNGWHIYKPSADKWLYKLSDGSNAWYTKDSEPSGATLFKGGNGFSTTKFSSINNDVFTLYAQWKANTYTFKYDANGGTGTMADTVSTYGITTATRVNTFTKTGYSFNGWHVYRDSTGKWLYKLSDGSNAWYTKGSEPSGATLFKGGNGFSTTTFSSVNNDVFTLYAQWKITSTIPTFTYKLSDGTDASHEIVDENDNIISDPSSYTGNWKIRFLESGTLTFYELHGAATGIDTFIVGGGGNGAGGGGGGGYTQTLMGNTVTVNKKYTITVGNAGEASIAFDTTANPGSNASGYNGGSGGSGGGSHGRDGGSDGSSGGTYSNSYDYKAIGGSGQTTTTREFGEATGKLYAGGGGGGSVHSTTSYVDFGAGGEGGGGRGSYLEGGYPGEPNTGGGGGGYGQSEYGPDGSGGTGGSGIVIIRNSALRVFTIDGKTYKSPRYYTWNDWLTSEYNTGGYVAADSNYMTNASKVGLVYNPSDKVYALLSISPVEGVNYSTINNTNVPKFTYDGVYELVDDNDNAITGSTSNWKIRFLESGTLTFYELRGAANGIDTFIVGGGGNGAGGGGGGGYTKTLNANTVTVNKKYTITVGNAGEASIAFDTTAKPGSNASGYNGGSGGSGGGSHGRAGGSDGSSGGTYSNSSDYKAIGGSGQTTTTREFGEATGKLYAGGGGGGSVHSTTSYVGFGAGGEGGGGRGSYLEGGYPGEPNTGGGGGGYVQSEYGPDGSGGTGGSGIVIIRNKR